MSSEKKETQTAPLTRRKSWFSGREREKKKKEGEIEVLSYSIPSAGSNSPLSAAEVLSQSNSSQLDNLLLDDKSEKFSFQGSPAGSIGSDGGHEETTVLECADPNTNNESECTERPVDKDVSSRASDDNKVQSSRPTTSQSGLSIFKSSSPFKIRNGIFQLLGLQYPPKEGDETSSVNNELLSQSNSDASELGNNTYNSFNKIQLMNGSQTDAQNDFNVIRKYLARNEATNTLNDYVGFPSLRLALINQNSSNIFQNQVKMIKQKSQDYYLNFRWIVWIDKKLDEAEEPPGSAATNVSANASTKTRNLEVSATVIQTKVELDNMVKSFKNLLEETSYHTHIFRTGFRPRRSSPELITGGTLEFIIPDGSEYEYWKFFLDVCIQDKSYTPFDIQQPVCGLTWRNKKSGSYSIASIWLHGNYGGIETPVLVAFCKHMKDIIPSNMMGVIDTATFVVCSTRRFCFIIFTKILTRTRKTLLSKQEFYFHKQPLIVLIVKMPMMIPKTQ